MNLKAPEQNLLAKLDAGVKLILAIVLSIIPFFCQKPSSFFVLVLFLGFLTILARVNLRTLRNSLLSYGIIVIFPYLFGFLVSWLSTRYSANALFVYEQGFSAMALRLFKLFLFWYVGTLYLHSTPLNSLVGVLDKCLYPLKKLGLPIADYLKVLMCVLETLKKSGSEVRKKFQEKKASLSGDHKSLFMLNIKGIAQTIVSFLVDSFQNLDQIQEDLSKIEAEDLYSYKLKVSKPEIMAIGCFLAINLGLYVIEAGHWL
ncbi:MAG: energy-coupling factor transporter transmembrane protein EcfT [Peptococcaceae bacterium]|jgi:energy-coupling factor transport system permease protein|nr:energy-coupling factor transporter transmembrane protein EcfT [Peptococcaceae bacterium]